MMSKNKLITLGAVLVIACLFIGYALGRIVKTKEISGQKMLDEKNSMVMDHNSLEMKHEHLEVAKFRLNPSVSLIATKDSMGGFNLNVKTTNFYFTPEKAGQPAIQNTGHAHIFINGVKIGRIYGPWIYLGDNLFKSGTNTIEVSLNANDHSVWVNNKTQGEISTTTEIYINK